MHERDRAWKGVAGAVLAAIVIAAVLALVATGKLGGCAFDSPLPTPTQTIEEQAIGETDYLGVYLPVIVKQDAK